MIYSDPAGADVYIFEKYSGKTPLLYIPDNAPDPPWTIEFRKDGYNSSIYAINENITPGTQKEIFVRLSPAPMFGTIFVSSDPDGCLAQLDGSLSVPLPYSFTSVPEGTHTLFVYKTGYKSYLNEQLSVMPNSKLTIKVILIPNYERKELVVTSTPPDTEVLVDGIFRGITSGNIPLMIGPLNDGQHTVLGRIAGYQEKKEIVFTRQDRSTNVHLHMIPITLMPMSSTLKIRSNPSGSDVLLNGIWFGEVPAQGYLELNDIPPNRYKLVISHSGYSDHIEWIFPGPGETITIDTALVQAG
ncbi:PEGA domain-containing protein [Methanospirillum hungatei]|uniref:PEGA domain-containing protein n=1 Tax=Methanospirillum hungatei TaxID=2203 RepID=UPI0026F1C0F2|nr:PEGA domain-containing protein [Methanospirillum hungatei]